MNTDDPSSRTGSDAPPPVDLSASIPTSAPAPLARRVVLRAGAALPVGIGLTSLSACGDDSGSTASESEAGSQGGVTAAEGDPDAAGQSSGDGAGTDPAAGFPSQDVPVGGATYDEPSNTVFSQPTEGEFRAFDATCPHQGCSVSQFSDGKLVCPCHGSAFDPATGDVVNGPATTGLTVRDVTVEGDDLVVG